MKKNTLNQWFFVHSYLPVILVLSFSLLLSLSVFLYSSLQSINSAKVFVEKTSQNLSLAILQKNRPQIENIISTLKNTQDIKLVAICKSSTIFFGSNDDTSICTSDNFLTNRYNLTSEKDLSLNIRFVNPVSTNGFKVTIAIILSSIFFTLYVLKRFKEKFQNDLIGGILNVDKEDFNSNIIEIENLSIDLKITQNLKIQLEKEKSINLFSLQVYHDIRSPLSVLKYSFLSESQNVDRTIANRALERITSIVEGLLYSSKSESNKSSFDNQNTKITTETVNILDFLEQIISEKKLEYLRFDLISINLSHEGISKQELVKLNKVELSRIISNIINNSIEAMGFKGVILVKLIKAKSNVTITISDNGGGMPENILSQLGKATYSTKESGHGLGLYHAINSIQRQDATIQFENIQGGLRVSLTFELINNIDLNYVLIDNDELTRMLWENSAKHKGVRLRTCSNVKNFQQIKNLINKETHFYIDSELDDQIKGEDFARLLHNEGYSNLYLSTGHRPEKFMEHCYLKGIISKAPPF